PWDHDLHHVSLHHRFGDAGDQRFDLAQHSLVHSAGADRPLWNGYDHESACLLSHDRAERVRALRRSPARTLVAKAPRAPPRPSRTRITAAATIGLGELRFALASVAHLSGV